MAPQPGKPGRPAPTPTQPCPPDKYVQVGQNVQHFTSPTGAKPTTALVTARGIDSIDCLAFESGYSGGYPQLGVYHCKYQADRISTEGYYLPLAKDVAVLTHMIACGVLIWDGEADYIPNPDWKPPAATPARVAA